MKTMIRVAVLIPVVAGLGLAGAGASELEALLGEPLCRIVEEDPSGGAPFAPLRSTTVNPWSRSQVASFFDATYTPALGVPMQWSGNAATCTAGATSQAYVDATFQMINYFRSMVGLPDVANNASLNSGCQDAALMMSVNGALNHYPPSTWTCYTSAGYNAASHSNLALGGAGPGAVTMYMRDSGSGNYFVGHRRWLLCPRRGEFGTGSVGGSTTPANALYVLTSTTARPPSPAKVPWPPEGYVPYQVVYPRWSLSLNTGSSVSFASASVTMTEGGSPVSLSVVSRTDNGYCDNTIVWEPSGLYFSAGMQDRRFTVTVSGISVSGAPQTVVYDVVVMDPAVNTDLVFTNGFESGNLGAWSSTVP